MSKVGPDYGGSSHASQWLVVFLHSFVQEGHLLSLMALYILLHIGLQAATDS